jgi:hypothetical protein
MNTTTSHDQALALANLKIVSLDLTAAHAHALDAASGLANARQARATQLTQLIADALTFTRRLAIVVEGDLRAE